MNESNCKFSTRVVILLYQMYKNIFILTLEKKQQSTASNISIKLFNEYFYTRFLVRVK